jgi:hypothetical protein
VNTLALVVLVSGFVALVAWRRRSRRRSDDEAGGGSFDPEASDGHRQVAKSAVGTDDALSLVASFERRR